MPEELKYVPCITDKLELVVRFLVCILAMLTAFYAGMLYANL